MCECVWDRFFTCVLGSKYLLSTMGIELYLISVLQVTNPPFHWNLEESTRMSWTCFCRQTWTCDNDITWQRPRSHVRKTRIHNAWRIFKTGWNSICFTVCEFSSKMSNNIEDIEESSKTHIFYSRMMNITVKPLKLCFLHLSNYLPLPACRFVIFPRNLAL